MTYNLDNIWYKYCNFLSMHLDFAPLTNIEGVLDLQLYNKWGHLVFPSVQYKDTRIAAVGREVALCLALLGRLETDVGFLELVYRNRRIIVKVAQDFLLLVLCDGSCDSTLIKLTMNVISQDLTNDRKLQKILWKAGGRKGLFVEGQQEPEWGGLMSKMGILS